MIKSRYLTHRAIFQRPIQSKDNSGQTVETWEDITHRFVDIRPISVDKEADQTTRLEVAKMELKTRYSELLQGEIDTNCRVCIKDKYYIIEEIGDLFSRSQLTYIIAAYE